MKTDNILEDSVQIDDINWNIMGREVRSKMTIPIGEQSPESSTITGQNTIKVDKDCKMKGLGQFIYKKTNLSIREKIKHYLLFLIGKI